MLPATNTSQVATPVVSPDGKQVAFLLLAGSTQLWTVDTTGHGQPTQISVKGLQLDGPSKVTLLAWK